MISKLKQLENYPTGDCQRTVFACLLGFDDPTMVPNFMEIADTEEEVNSIFTYNMNSWLDNNDLQYIEVSLEEFKQLLFIPEGYCTILGKSPRGEYNHVVVGKIIKNGDQYEVYFEWDTSPYHDGRFIDGDIKAMGFLSRKL